MGNAGAADPFVKQNEATQQVKDLKPLLVGINKLKLERKKQPKEKAEKAIQQHQMVHGLPARCGESCCMVRCGAVLSCTVLYSIGCSAVYVKYASSRGGHRSGLAVGGGTPEQLVPAARTEKARRPNKKMGTKSDRTWFLAFLLTAVAKYLTYLDLL